MPEQVPLLAMPLQPEPEPRPQAPPTPAKAKLKPIDRSQGLLRPVVVEELVPPDHSVRAIWDLISQLDMQPFEDRIRSKEGRQGRAAWNPCLLASTWVYGYSQGVTSAREIERLMEYEPGLMWLSGLGEINHHTLSDFRSQHDALLRPLLVEVLGVLSRDGFVKLELVAQDGTKIRAQAGADTFRRQPSLEKHLAEAQQAVEELERQAASAPEDEAGPTRREQARKRAARELLERMRLAGQELEKVRAAKKSEQDEAEARVSLTEPEARIMHQADGGSAPSYNVQLSTDAEHKIIVGMHVTQSSSDGAELLPGMQQVEATAGRYPDKAVADGAYTSKAALTGMAENNIDYYGSVQDEKTVEAAAMKRAGIDPAFGPSAFIRHADPPTLTCPAGKTLVFLRHNRKREDDRYDQYRARGADCQSCPHRQKCCPKHAEQGRLVSIKTSTNPLLEQLRAKMKTPEGREIYRQRGAVAEFPNCWIKEKLGLRKFRLRGLAKVATETLWGVLSYNILQWKRLSWMPKLLPAAANPAI